MEPISMKDQEKMVKDAIAQFPAEFGLRGLGFEGETFRCNYHQSYVSEGEVIIYLDIKHAADDQTANVRWEQFCKSTVDELKSQIVVFRKDLPNVGQQYEMRLADKDDADYNAFGGLVEITEIRGTAITVKFALIENEELHFEIRGKDIYYIPDSDFDAFASKEGVKVVFEVVRGA